MADQNDDEARRQAFLETPRKFFIYHVVGRKVGCTLHLESQTKRLRKNGESWPTVVLEEVEGLASEAAERKRWWEDHFGYRRSPHYDRTNWGVTVPIGTRRAVGARSKGRPRSP